MAPLRILFVWPGADHSIHDVGAGLHAALTRAGHDLRDYVLTKRITYHAAAMKLGGLDLDDPKFRFAIHKQACDSIVVEALYHNADLVLVVSGLNVHPDSLALVERVRIPIAIVLTESPYEDKQQDEFCRRFLAPIVFTNERTSAERFGWHYLPAAYDATRHRPAPGEPALATDVIFIGTGWPNRQALFESVDWTGIDIKFVGPFPYMPADSSIKPFHEDIVVSNDHAIELYRAAKICINPHRESDDAESLGPRSYELAACRAFQISDARAEGIERFGDAMPTFTNGKELERIIRHFLANPEDRERLADAQHAAIEGESFDARARRVLQVIEDSDVLRRLATLEAI